MSVTYQTLLNEIRSGQFRPMYLICGEEPYFIDRLAEALEESVVPEQNRGFGQFILYGADHSVRSAIQYARNYPFLGGQQLVMVKEAQKLSGIEGKSKQAAGAKGARKNAEPGKDDGQNLLEEYAANPQTSTVFVIVYQGKIDERRAFVKAFARAGAFYQSSRIYENKLPEWIEAYCREQQLKISRRAVEMIANNIGTDLKRIHNEIQKVKINLAPGENMSEEHIEKFIGISREYNIFELQNALASGDSVRATRIGWYFADNTRENPPIMIVLMLFSFFTRILLCHTATDRSKNGVMALLGVNYYQVENYMRAAGNYNVPRLADIIFYLREADCRLKGIGTGSMTDSSILKDLILKITLASKH